MLQKMQRCSEFIALYGIASNQLYRRWISKLLHEIHGFMPYPCWAGAGHPVPDASAHFFSAVVGLFGWKNQIDSFQANKGGNQHHQSLDKPQYDDPDCQQFRPLTCHLPGFFSWRGNGMVGEGYLQCLSRGIKDSLMSLHIHGRKAPDTNAAGFPPPPLHGC